MSEWVRPSWKRLSKGDKCRVDWLRKDAAIVPNHLDAIYKVEGEVSMAGSKNAVLSLDNGREIEVTSTSMFEVLSLSASRAEKSSKSKKLPDISSGYPEHG